MAGTLLAHSKEQSDDYSDGGLKFLFLLKMYDTEYLLMKPKWLGMFFWVLPHNLNK